MSECTAFAALSQRCCRLLRCKSVAVAPLCRSVAAVPLLVCSRLIVQLGSQVGKHQDSGYDFDGFSVAPSQEPSQGKERQHHDDPAEGRERVVREAI